MNKLIELIELITQEPSLKDYNLKMPKKYFKKKWHELINAIDYTGTGSENLLNQLLNQPPTIKYNKSYYFIPCFLPIKKEFLQKITKNENIYIECSGYQKEQLRIKMFTNFIEFISMKKVNFKDLDNGYNLTGKLLSRIMQWEHSNFSYFLNGDFFKNKLQELNNDEKSNVIDCIINDWEKIWTKDHIENLKVHYINSKYEDVQTIILGLKLVINSLFDSSCPIHNSQFNSILENVKKFEPYSSEVEDIVKKGATIQLFSKLQNLPVNNSGSKKFKI